MEWGVAGVVVLMEALSQDRDGRMDEAWAARLKMLKDAPGTVLDQGMKGVDYLKSSIGSLPFFAATSVDAAEGNPERDETHYFLLRNWAVS